jgi:hypothetical protein
MSAKHPPLDLLVRMGRSNFNVMTSIACLTAALAVQRKDFTAPEIETIGGEPLTPEAKARILAAIERVRESFLTASPDELQAAIELYVAHLKFCGFSAEWGQTN